MDTHLTRHTVTIGEENAFAALEVMSRFAAALRWLVYLPATMAPKAVTARPGLLESDLSIPPTLAAVVAEPQAVRRAHLL